MATNWPQGYLGLGGNVPKSLILLVGRDGFEPSTNGLKGKFTFFNLLIFKQF